MLKARFGITAQPADSSSSLEAIAAARAAMIKQLGEHGYWMNHLDYTRTEIALVNSNSRQGIDDKRLRWVPHASTLLYPLPADHLMARSPSHKADIAEAQKDLQGFLTEADLPGFRRTFPGTSASSMTRCGAGRSRVRSP